MDQKTIEALGDSLYDALVARTPIAPLSAAHPDMTIEDAYHVQQRMKVGLSWVNSWFLRDLRTPFGGSKQSGIGREGGVHSLEFYTELRNVMVKL